MFRLCIENISTQFPLDMPVYIRIFMCTKLGNLELVLLYAKNSNCNHFTATQRDHTSFAKLSNKECCIDLKLMADCTEEYVVRF